MIFEGQVYTSPKIAWVGVESERPNSIRWTSAIQKKFYRPPQRPLQLNPMDNAQAIQTELVKYKKTINQLHFFSVLAVVMVCLAFFCFLPSAIAIGTSLSVVLLTILGSSLYKEKKVTKYIEAICHQFCSKQALEKSAKAWSKEIVNAFNIEENCCVTGLLLPITLPPEKYLYYCALQEEIARRIPNETNRPTIYLKLRGNELLKNQASFGIIGGVGPLSDAAIIKEIMIKLDNAQLLQTVKIDLFSSPPPRIENKSHFVLHFFNYLYYLIRFLHSQEILNFCVVSNTAHLNFDFLQSMANNKMVNLVEAVSEHIRLLSKKRSVHVLVLGTIESHRKKLYPNILSNKGIKTTTLDELDALLLQEIIDQTKAGKNNKDNVAKLLKIIKDALDKVQKDTPITDILLGCTELPLVLTSSEDASIMQAIETLKAQYGFIDTEQQFSEAIIEAIQHINCNTDILDDEAFAALIS